MGVEPPYPRGRRAWTLVSIFAVASVVSVLDRGVLNLVVDPVRADLGISDVQISLLQGLSFGLFYATVSVPLGFLADRVQRLRLITAGVFLWSLATIMGGFAPTYEWMFASRLLLGLGEATLGPCAVSMIGDMFPPTRRGRPMSVYMLGQAVSGGLSMMLIGLILVHASQGLFDAVPVLRDFAPWRVVFVIAGMLGLGVAVLFMTQREPARRGMAMQARGRAGIAEAVGYLWTNRAVFVPFYLGFSVFTLASYGIMAWSAVVLMRQFDMAPGLVSRDLGVATLIAGTAGPLLAGVIIDYQARRRRRTAKLRMLTVLPLLALPSAMATYAPTGAAALILLSLVCLVLPMVGTSMMCGVQEMVPNTMRGMAVALFGLLNTFIGAAMGPFLIALITEQVFRDPRLVGVSVVVVATPAILIGSGLYLLSYLAMRKSLSAPTNLKAVMDAEAG